MTKKHVLVIDDENFVRKTICDNLKLSGYQIASAANDEEGLKMIEASALPGVVITDIIMPGMSGLEVISEIRKSYPSIKVIAISGGGRIKESEDLLEKARELGANATLSKPIDLDELERAVEELLG